MHLQLTISTCPSKTARFHCRRFPEEARPQGLKNGSDMRLHFFFPSNASRVLAQFFPVLLKSAAYLMLPNEIF